MEAEDAPQDGGPPEDSRGAFVPGGPPEDRAVLEGQLTRDLYGSSRVASRCALGLPVALEVHPDNEGYPFPTLYYLTCPLARARISRLESAGGVRDMAARAEGEAAFGEALDAAHAHYRAARAAHLPEGSPLLEQLTGGVAGVARGVKCLHAHYAHRRCGGPNPVGEHVAAQVEPLDCSVPCVFPDGERNPAWSGKTEPRRT